MKLLIPIASNCSKQELESGGIVTEINWQTVAKIFPELFKLSKEEYVKGLSVDENGVKAYFGYKK